MNRKIGLLYVDDEPLNLSLFSINFGEKYYVLTADSGYKGIEVLKSGKYIDIVISDMKMPGMNGLEFIKKAKGEFPEILCYILTGFEITKEIADALRDNLIIKYFRKPFNMMEIDHSIQEVIKGIRS
jgi:two-component system, response regulator, stage 0 sporulation protein F